ncbi:hypothetical protein GAMM_200030 [Gammaproteobacteria bacterium]
MQGDFKSLIENYAFQGRDVKHLSRDELFGLTLAYLENKFSKSKCIWSGSYNSNDNIDIELTLRTLHKLNSNIYNHQKIFLEKVKDSIIEAQLDNVSEALDDEIEHAKNRCVGNDDHGYCGEQFNLLNIFNAGKKQEVSYGNATRR